MHNLRTEGPPSQGCTDNYESEFLRAVLENMTEGVVAFDNNWNITYLNRAAREMDGAHGPLSHSEWARGWQFFQPDGVTRIKDEDLPISHVYRGERIQNMEMVVLNRPSGRTHRLLVSGQGLYG